MHPNVKKNLATFRGTYQKPSRIYRFLFEEWKTHPLFLNRTLSYVNKHRDRKIKPRQAKIDDVARELSLKNNGTTSKSSITSCWQPSATPGGRVRCLFNWICDDPEKTCQKTRSFGFICPWCEIDCRYLDTLMMHLKCCHPRFNFNLVEEDGYSVIEMSLNISYDGSYCGFKYPGHDLKRDFRFNPTTPRRRNNHTQIIFIKSKRRLTSHFIHRYSPSDQHFATIDEGDVDVDVDVCSGRLYYHTSTCLPVKPNEGDIDSEADMDPEWLKERTQLMIDEFTDVNEGEKELLKLWNLHIMSNYKYKNDSMIRLACLDFVEREGNTILSKNLTKNFVLHLANLYDYGLLSSGDVLECFRKFRRMKGPPQIGPIRSASRVKLERSSNEHCQLSTPAKRERALLNSHCNQ